MYQLSRVEKKWMHIWDVLQISVWWLVDPLFLVSLLMPPSSHSQSLFCVCSWWKQLVQEPLFMLKLEVLGSTETKRKLKEIIRLLTVWAWWCWALSKDHLPREGNTGLHCWSSSMFFSRSCLQKFVFEQLQCKVLCRWKMLFKTMQDVKQLFWFPTVSCTMIAHSGACVLLEFLCL